jgi:hypothetical protein
MEQTAVMKQLMAKVSVSQMVVLVVQVVEALVAVDRVLQLAAEEADIPVAMED